MKAKLFKIIFGTAQSIGLSRDRLLCFLEPALIVIAVICLELVGQYCTSDYYDLGMLVVLIPLGIFLYLVCRNNRMYVLEAVMRLLSRVWKTISRRIDMDVGVDFRVYKQDGLHPRQRYKEMRYILAAAVLLCLIAIPFHSIFPAALKLVHEKTLYTPYLSVVYLLWGVLAFSTLLALVIMTFLFTFYVLKSPYRNPKSLASRQGMMARVHPRRFYLLMSVVLCLVALEVLFGKHGWFWLMGATLCVTMALAFIPRSNQTLGMLVKHPLRHTIQSTSISEWNFTLFAIVQAFTILLFVITTGAGWTSDPLVGDANPMGFTHVLGRIFGASMGVSMLFCMFATIDYFDLKRRRGDPARTLGKVLCYRPDTLPENVAIPGWELVIVRHSPVRDEGDLYFDPDPERRKESGVPCLTSDPLQVDPENRAFHLDRRDFILKRRAFFRGLEVLMKICHASSFKGGRGFILIPNCYFVEGLHRDDGEEEHQEYRVIGPSFQQLWGLRVRHFVHNLLEAMDLDIVFFEDGIKFKQMKAVFEILFELYHNRGPHFKLEEHHFVGLPGVHVFLEPIRPDRDRPKNSEYPETHFSNLSQARVMMIFKDRGGNEEKHPDLAPVVDIDLPVFI